MHCNDPSPLAAQQLNNDDISTKHWLVDLETTALLTFNLGKGGMCLGVWTFLIGMVTILQLFCSHHEAYTIYFMT